MHIYLTGAVDFNGYLYVQKKIRDNFIVMLSVHALHVRYLTWTYVQHICCSLWLWLAINQDWCEKNTNETLPLAYPSPKQFFHTCWPLFRKNKKQKKNNFFLLHCVLWGGSLDLQMIVSIPTSQIRVWHWKWLWSWWFLPRPSCLMVSICPPPWGLTPITLCLHVSA